MCYLTIRAIDISQWSIATVVGISSAFPPVLSPVVLKLDRTNWVESGYQKFFSKEKFKSELRLCDGGLYDNLGIECLWKKDLKKLRDTSHEYNAVLADDIDICLVSDAGAPLMQQADTKSSVASQLKRLIDIMGSQVGALRKRYLIEYFISPEHKLKGTYWGISTEIEKYKYPSSLTDDNDITKSLENVETVLTPLPDKTKAYLVNWAYALTDSAIQIHCCDSLKIIECTPSWPLPEYPLNS
jgi:NTE family protein